MLHKCNCMAWNPLGLTCFTQHNSLKIHPNCCVYQYLVPLYCCILFYGMAGHRFLIRYGKASGVLPAFACYESNSYAHLCTGSCVNISFHVYVQECNFWVIWEFLRNCLTVFQNTVPFYIPTRNVWVIQLLWSLPAFGVSSLFCFSHSDRYTVIAHCGFNLLFPNAY